jgi:hypothetical protein
VPLKLEEADENLKRQQDSYDNMIQLRPIKEQLAAIQDRDLPALRKQLDKVTAEVVSLRQTIEEVSFCLFVVLFVGLKLTKILSYKHASV